MKSISASGRTYYDHRWSECLHTWRHVYHRGSVDIVTPARPLMRWAGPSFAFVMEPLKDIRPGVLGGILVQIPRRSDMILNFPHILITIIILQNALMDQRRLASDPRRP